MKKEFLTIYSIILAVIGLLITMDVALWSQIGFWCLLIDFAVIIFSTFLVIYGLSIAYNKRWIDKMCFHIKHFFRKDNIYFIENMAEWEISKVTDKECCGEYKVSCKVKSSTSKPVGQCMDFWYTYWDQQKEETVTPYYKGRDTQDFFVSDPIVDGRHKHIQIINDKAEKDSVWVGGFRVSNLQVFDYRDRSFISCNIHKEIEKLVLVLRIDEKLPYNKEARLIVKDEKTNQVISDSEIIKFNEYDKCFKHELYYPRKGRIYELKVNYYS